MLLPLAACRSSPSSWPPRPSPPPPVELNRLDADCLRTSALDSVSRNALEALELPLSWTASGRDRVRAEIQGKADHLLILTLAPRIDNSKLVVSARGTALQSVACGVYRVDEGTYAISFPWKPLTNPPTDLSVRAYLVVDPEVRTKRLKAAYEEIDPPKDWSEINSLNEFKTTGVNLEELLRHADGLRTLRSIENGQSGKWPEDAGLDEETLIQTLEKSFQQLLKHEGRTPDLFLNIARVYHQIGEGSGSSFEPVRKRLKQLEASALAEHLNTEAESLREEASSFMASKVDGLLQEIMQSDTQSACDSASGNFPSQAANDNIWTMIRIAQKYMEADLCGNEDSHLERLDNLLGMVRSLESRCWLGDAANLRRMEEELNETRLRVEWSIRFRNGERPPEYAHLVKSLSAVSEGVDNAFKTIDIANVGALRTRLERLNFPDPGIRYACDSRSNQRITAEFKDLRGQRDVLFDDLRWLSELADSPWIADNQLPGCLEIGRVARGSQRRQKAFCTAAYDIALRVNCSARESIRDFLECRSQTCADVSQRLQPIFADCELERLERRFRELAQLQSCRGCAGMTYDMERLRQGEEWERALAESLQEIYDASVREAARGLFERDPERCDRQSLDPRSPGQETCCGLSADQIGSSINLRLDSCCEDAFDEWQGRVRSIDQNLARLENRSGLSWSEFKSLSREIASDLRDSVNRGSRLEGCPQEPADPLSAQEAQWHRILTENDGALLNLVDLVLGRTSNVFLDPQPLPGQILSWISSFKNQIPSGEAWDLLLGIADKVRQIDSFCGSAGVSNRLDHRARDLYDELRRDRQRLEGMNQDLYREARAFSQVVDDCLDRHKDRTLRIPLDENCSYDADISPEEYGFLTEGRRIQLQFYECEAIPNLSSLTIELYSNGFTVKATDSGGLDDTDNPAREFTKDRSPLRGFEYVYRSYERLTEDPAASKAYFLIEPISSEAPRRLYLHVVPRTH